MKILKLTLECHAHGSEKLAEMGINGGSAEWRPCVVPLDAIMAIYPDVSSGTIIMIGSMDLHFSESYNDVVRMILNS